MIFLHYFHPIFSHVGSLRIFKESGPFVETPHIFLSMQNINYAEILA